MKMLLRQNVVSSYSQMLGTILHNIKLNLVLRLGCSFPIKNQNILCIVYYICFVAVFPFWNEIKIQRQIKIKDVQRNTISQNKILQLEN